MLSVVEKRKIFSLSVLFVLTWILPADTQLLLAIGFEGTGGRVISCINFEITAAPDSRVSGQVVVSRPRVLSPNRVGARSN